jgi:alpha-ribazole phosphatase
MPLEENFTTHFDWINEQISPAENTIYFSSPLRRCTKLASYLSNDKFIADNRILDLNYGVWEMKEWAEIPEKELNAWNADFVDFKIKKGESFFDLYERAIEFYEEITTENKHSENIIIVTHAAVIRFILAYVMDFPLENAFNLKISYNSISKLTYDSDSEINSVEYLNLNATHFKLPVESIED